MSLETADFSTGQVALLVPAGQYAGRAPTVMPPVMLIGSGEECHIRLLSRAVGRIHALIMRTPEGIFIRDLASPTGTLVNGQPVRERQLVHGDEVKIGKYLYSVVTTRSAIAAVEPPPFVLEIDGGEAISVRARIVLVGWDEACDVRIFDPTIAAQHAVILLANGKRYIRDLNTQSGTFVNGQQVRHQKLMDGDTVGIGLASMAMVHQASEPAMASQEATGIEDSPDFSQEMAMSDLSAGRPRVRQVEREMKWISWPVYFVWYALACQLGILFLGNTPLRLPLRVATYGGSLLLLCFFPARFQTHPALKLLKWVPIILAVGLLHPEHNSLLAGMAQILMYISIYAPLAWVAGSKPDFAMLRKVLLALWIFNLASASVGVLQVYYPGRFQGALSTVINARGTFHQGDAVVVLADGTHILRPFGLTDTPGGAAEGALNAIVFGAGILLAERNLLLRFCAAGGLLVGLFAIFLSQVRVELVMSGMCAIVLLFMLMRRGQWKQVIAVGSVMAAIAIGGATWAFAVGGKQTIARFSTLTADDPTNVYAANRGYFIDELVNNDLSKYPFGAGLGRWGMMNYYFGHHESSLYSEIMWTSWLYDGGIPMIVLYSLAFGIAIWMSWRLAIQRRDAVGLWSSIIFAFNIAALAGTFVFPLFAIQAGMEIWLINACLFSASLLPDGAAEIDATAVASRVPMAANIRRNIRRRNRESLIGPMATA